MIEFVERRFFGALEFVHAVTGARVLDALKIRADGLSLLRNPSGLHVIREVEGLDAYTRAFDSPPVLPRQPFTLTIEDPKRRFLPRSVTLDLPRLLPQPAADLADEDNALKPVQVRLWPAAGLPLQPGWAVLRVKVAVQGIDPEIGLANVLIEAAPQVAGAALKHALTDRHGEALLIVNDVAPILPDAGPVGLTTEFSVSLTLLIDAAVVRPANPAAPDAAFPIANPETILERRSNAAAGVVVVTGGEPVLSAGLGRRHVEKVTWP